MAAMWPLTHVTHALRRSQWTTVTAMPTVRDKGISFVGAEDPLQGLNVAITGGGRGIAAAHDLERYTVAADMWTTVSQVPSVVDSGKGPARLAGIKGQVLASNTNKVMEAYNVTTDSWMTLNSIPSAAGPIAYDFSFAGINQGTQAIVADKLSLPPSKPAVYTVGDDTWRLEAPITLPMKADALQAVGRGASVVMAGAIATPAVSNKVTQVYALPTAITNADVGKNVSIGGDALNISGKPRDVTWTDAKHHDCSGKIKSAEEKYKGKVQLEDGQEFENGMPAWRSVNNMPTGRQKNAAAAVDAYCPGSKTKQECGSAVVVIAGWQASTSHTYNQNYRSGLPTEVYTVVTDTWVTIAQAPSSRASLARDVKAAVVSGGNTVLLGGGMYGEADPRVERLTTLDCNPGQVANMAIGACEPCPAGFYCPAGTMHDQIVRDTAGGPSGELVRKRSCAPLHVVLSHHSSVH